MGKVNRESTEPLGTGLAVRAPMEWGREFQPSSGGVIFFLFIFNENGGVDSFNIDDLSSF